MSYYTERHGLRNPVEKTYNITSEIYSVLYGCCERYFIYIAWKYKKECPDGRGCCGLDKEAFDNEMRFEIPGLFRGWDGRLSNVVKSLVYNHQMQYAILDLIEFMYDNVRDIIYSKRHEYYKHDDISFGSSFKTANKFREEINSNFNKMGLLYTLNEDGMVERIVENTVLNNDIEKTIDKVNEPEIKKLLNQAILSYKTPHPDARETSVEKIWDALERLKTYYTSLDKKHSSEKIVNDMSNAQQPFIDLFNAEFKTLTDIGNKFRIRHHETDKIDITDSRHYDYFFNRCLSLIALAIQYLE